MLKPFVLGISFLGLASPADAEQISITDAQFLYGGGFHDFYLDTDTTSGRMATLRIEHFGTWSYGDNYFLVNLHHGEFEEFTQNPSGQDVKIFTKLTPRVSVGKVIGKKKGWSWGPFQDFLIAGQLYRSGNGFWANFIGIGVDFQLEAPLMLGSNFFLRKDQFNDLTFQISPFWTFPFRWIAVDWVFTGYLDLSGTDDSGLDLFVQPQFLLDIGATWSEAPNIVQVGFQWTFHRNEVVETSAMEGVLKWIW